MGTAHVLLYAAFVEHHLSASLRLCQRIRGVKSQNLMVFVERHPSVSLCLHLRIRGKNLCTVDGVRRTPSACFSAPTPVYTRAEIYACDGAIALMFCNTWYSTNAICSFLSVDPRIQRICNACVYAGNGHQQC